MIKELENLRGKNMNEKLADWMEKLMTAHAIEEAFKISEDDSKPHPVDDEEIFAITEIGMVTPALVKYSEPFCFSILRVNEKKRLELFTFW